MTNKDEVESDAAKLISDDSSSDVEDIDIENFKKNHIWNSYKANVQYIWCDYLGHDFQWAVWFEIITPPPSNDRLLSNN